MPKSSWLVSIPTFYNLLLAPSLPPPLWHDRRHDCGVEEERRQANAGQQSQQCQGIDHQGAARIMVAPMYGNGLFLPNKIVMKLSKQVVRKKFLKNPNLPLLLPKKL